MAQCSDQGHAEGFLEEGATFGEPAELGHAAQDLPQRPHGTFRGREPGPEGNHINNGILDTLIRAGIPILGFEPQGGRLQDVFLDLTTKALK